MAARGVLRTVEGGRLAFHCPGCDQRHMVGPGWSFNGDYDRPTFSPSIHILADVEVAAPMRMRPTLCHSFVTDGRIQFLGDCAHALAGQTVDLHPFSEA